MTEHCPTCKQPWKEPTKMDQIRALKINEVLAFSTTLDSWRTLAHRVNREGEIVVTVTKPDRKRKLWFIERVA